MSGFLLTVGFAIFLIVVFFGFSGPPCLESSQPLNSADGFSTTPGWNGDAPEPCEAYPQ